jgi:uncharacterized surface protein with fasciclin (FAS1) repeats
MKKMMYVLSCALMLAVLLTQPIFAQDMAMNNTVTVGGEAMYPQKNIIENAVNSKDHTTLVAAVKAAGLVETLQGKGPFTVFAPTNDAFENLPAGTVETLLKPENKETLTKILTYHVVSGKYELRCACKSYKSRKRQGNPQNCKRRHFNSHDEWQQKHQPEG